jgi:hypothetical protein
MKLSAKLYLASYLVLANYRGDTQRPKSRRSTTGQSLRGLRQQALPMAAHGDDDSHQECGYHCRPAPRPEIRLQPIAPRHPLQCQGKQAGSC